MTKLLCVDPIPARGLFGGQIYTQLATWHCCDRFLPCHMVSIAESIGHTDAMRCIYCSIDIPLEPTGWYDAKRFVPWNPPHISLDEVKILYQPAPEKVKA